MTGEAGSLIDEIRAAPRPHPGGACGVAKMLGRMDPKLAEELRAALAMPDLTGVAISDALRRRGYTVSSYTLNRHRRGVCSCGPG